MILREWQESLQLSILDASMHLQPISCDGNASSIQLHKHKLAIYQNAYRIRLIEALRTNYPVLHRLLGDVVFSQLGLSLILASPPQHASIRWFGHDLASYLEKKLPFSDLPVLVDLARFEWALRHTVDAADATPWTVSMLEQVPASEWVHLSFRLHPSVSRLRMQWNALEIWKTLTEDATAIPPTPERHCVNWLIWRSQDLSSQWRSLEEEESLALQSLAEGATFAQLCEQQLSRSELNEQEDQVATQVAAWLKAWVRDQLLVQS